MIQIRGLEYSIIQNCNLACPLCAHQAWRADKKYSLKETIINDLKLISKYIISYELRIIGGEPLLHPDIVNIMKDVYKLKINNNIVLATNATLIKDIHEELFDYFDCLKITLYSYSKKKVDINKIKELCNKHHKKIIVLQFDHIKILEFIRCNEDEAQRRWDNCFMRRMNICTSVCDGRFYPCAISQAMPYWIHKFVKNFDGSKDYADIKNLSELEYITNKKEHSEACHFCTGCIVW
jgi:organic radical activating enzyme